MSIRFANILFVSINFSCRIEQALHKNMLQSDTSSAEKNLIVHEGIIGAVDMYRRANKFVIND